MVANAGISISRPFLESESSYYEIVCLPVLTIETILHNVHSDRQRL